MNKSSFLVFIIGAILGILIITGNLTADEYSMALSYYMLLPAIIYFDKFFDKYSLINSLFVIISLIVILALGSRGAILCFLIFAILKIVRNDNFLTYKKAFSYLFF
ncbi:hypothetical protein [Sinobaca sp. H24]|uniref:hypothetical protein n=1 Tax=Sinobaca sp. H24 TaxID=2923376 RepID=UPI00207A52E5|nr:hypothetical protein [Sinobaca sp. H24]